MVAQRGEDMQPGPRKGTLRWCCGLTGAGCLVHTHERTTDYGHANFFYFSSLGYFIYLISLHFL